MPRNLAWRNPLRPRALVLPLCFALAACSPQEAATTKAAKQRAADGEARIERALEALPEVARSAAGGRIRSERRRFDALFELAERERRADPLLLARVDKAKALPADYEPADLVNLDESGLSVGRKGHRLRRAAFEALLAMDRAARREKIVLLVYSSFRSWSYQSEVFGRNGKGISDAEAALLTAKPGHSQHQLGTALDFGPIDDSFAATKAGRWLMANAGVYGFSLSYPKGLADVTGYSWESWHFRYIGKAAVALQSEFFEGIQQYLMLFLDKYDEK